uniref:Putative ribonucleoside diphosphate reductase n=1 Tax=viral metagenome TaxID=1070528 RepID=A0A6M3IFN6_9ZZZZ
MKKDKTSTVPENIKKAFDESNKYFPTAIQAFQYLDKYARYNYDLNRRETWVECVDRAVNYLKELSENKLQSNEYEKIRKFILEFKATPSMRLLAMSGEAARRQNVSIYNCSFVNIDSIDAIVEELIISMAGCGVGWSVEKQHIDKLPEVKIQTGEILPIFQVPDSTEGWTEAFRTALKTYFDGKNIQFDYSLIRPDGTPLKIKGGRASGPALLQKLLEFTRTIILKRQGQKLRSIDVHDILCKMAEAIVSGGVRRTACISLFDDDDDEMLNCKNGENLKGNEHRWMSNNSTVWTEDVTQNKLLKQMFVMIDGQRGEPGIFSRFNANKIKPERRKESAMGTNPCGEINLRSAQFCNLSIAIARPGETEETLKEKIEVATIIGTIQSMATNFPGLRDIWRQNCEEERLLGVDINGWVDSEILRPSNPDLPKMLRRLRTHAVEINKKYAEKLGINQSTAVTTVKPSGNSSQLFDCSSGIHARHYPYYIRNVRVQASSPLRKLLEEQGVPMHPENGQTELNATAYVIHFPVKSPEGTLVKENMSAIDQLEYWLIAKLNWTEHNPSVTVTYRPDEVINLIDWIYKHREYIGGLSFLPADNARYDQMPYEPITKEEYELLIANFPPIDFSQLWIYEKTDMTDASKELACVNGVCNIDEYQAKEAAEAANLI